MSTTPMMGTSAARPSKIVWRAGFARLVPALSATILLAALTVGCGGDPPASASKPPSPPQRKAKVVDKPEERENIVHVPNPRWERLQEHFERYAAEPAMTKKDPYRDNMVSFIEIPELPPEPAPEPVHEEEVVEERILSPLQRYRTEDYKLVLILSGTVVPRAVVVDPIGNSWMVRRDDPFGNKNGVVLNITQYSILVKEPGVDQPIEKTIRPPIFALAENLSLHSVHGAELLTTAPPR